MSLIIANVIGFIRAHWRWFAYGLAALVLLIAVVVVFKSCGKSPKLNEAEIQAGEKAVKDRNDAELRRILVESEVREKAIDANVANAEAEKLNAIKESRDKWANANVNDLQAEFDRRKNEQ